MTIQPMAPLRQPSFGLTLPVAQRQKIKTALGMEITPAGLLLKLEKNARLPMGIASPHFSTQQRQRQQQLEKTLLAAVDNPQIGLQEVGQALMLLMDEDKLQNYEPSTPAYLEQLVSKLTTKLEQLEKTERSVPQPTRQRSNKKMALGNLEALLKQRGSRQPVLIGSPDSLNLN